VHPPRALAPVDAADVAWLRTPEGAAAAAEAARLLEAGTELAALRRLNRKLASGEARAAVALAGGRRVAADQLEDADQVFCEREAAEQASDERVARHLARRFADYQRVADLGCGMGGDTLALAAHLEVLAVDRDPSRLAMTAANADARGLAAHVETA